MGALRSCLFWGLAGTAFASQPWTLPFFTAEPKAVVAEAAKIKPPGAKDLVLLDSNCSMKISQQGRALTTCRFLFRPVSKAGAEMIGTFQLPWAAWREEKPLLRIRVIAPNASASLLDPSKITETGSVPAGKLLEAPLPAVAIDSVIEIETVVQDKLAVVSGSRFAYFEPDNLPIGHWQASVEVPATMPLRVKAERLPGARRTEAHAGPTQKVTIEFSEAGVRKELPAAPPEAGMPPRVAISAGPGWDTIAGEFGQAAEPQLGAVATAAYGASEAQRPSTIANLLAAVQAGIRDNGAELGSLSYAPRAPREIADSRTGDSLDLAVVLAARLRSSGIAAYLALLTPSPGPDAESDLPGIEAFTHAVVYVPGRQTLWLDPSAPFVASAALPAADQGRMALVARPGTAALVRTPISAAAENKFTEYQNITLAATGRGDIDEIEEGEGYFGPAFRVTGAAMKAATPNERESYEKSLAAAFGFEKVVQDDVVNLTDLSKPIRLVFAGTGYRHAVTEGGVATAWVPEIAANGAVAGGILNPLLAGVKQEPARSEDYYAVTRCVVERRVRISAPAGYRVSQLPRLQPTAIGPLLLARQIDLLADGGVEVVYRLEVSRNRFSGAEAKAIGADMARLEAQPLLRIDFARPGVDPASGEPAEHPGLESLLANGDYGRAADLLARGGPDDATAALLRRTHRATGFRTSDDPLIAVAQEVIRGLLDPKQEHPWRIFYADRVSQSATLESERARLVDALRGYRQVAGVSLDLQALSDVALSNLQLSYTGSAQAGFRIRFPDPARAGAMSTLGSFIKDGDAYRAIGMGDSAEATR